jgi:diguanylate cyclase (GGDEF)-like protein
MQGSKPMASLLDQQRFMEELEAQQKLVSRANGLSALVLIDIDSFKDISAKHSRLVVETTIKRFTQSLQSSLRRSDICRHYGVEKFAVAMPATDVIQAAEKIDRIRNDFSKLEQASAAGDFNVTFSAGIAAITADTADLFGLIETARIALSEAKNAGHNMVKIAP